MVDVLVIHEDPAIRQALVHHILATEHRPHDASDLAQAQALRHRLHAGVVVTSIPAGQTPATFVQSVKSDWPAAEIVVVMKTRDGEAADSLKHIACDKIVFASPSEVVKVVHAVKAAAARRPHEPQSSWRHEAVHADSRDSVTRGVFERADRAALVNSTVLIAGESGTGKEVLARRIHRHSSRARGKFVPVNCGSLPDTLIETELFGYKKGAFTGAVADAKGLVEEADHGVLFLDEIGETPPAMQVRLLRFLDSCEVRAVGGTSFRHVDVRIIAATNRSLEDEVRAKRFREDLYFRLSVVPLRLPPLRERKVDIPDLVDHYIRNVASAFCVQPPPVSDAAMAMLIGYDWPGNIRELQNALEHALVQAVGDTITPDALPPAVRRGRLLSAGKAERSDDEFIGLVDALRRHRGNHADTAASLGISRTTLWRRLKQLDVTPDLRGDLQHAAVRARTALEREPL
jgi:DNA-binding NtrC family response regulator